MDSRRGLPDPEFWCGRRVFLTGHTGFKGAWLSVWLAEMGAEVFGYSLAPPTEPNLFEAGNVAETLAADSRGDIRALEVMEEVLAKSEAEVVIHMAAQALVRPSYNDPLGTFSTNVMGTANVLAAAAKAASVRTMVVVTTDKCYENREWVYPYRELDPLGGHDPYSASKAAAELVAGSWRSSFGCSSAMRIATARAGNVIGAGDWAEERLIPDCARAFSADKAVFLRNPGATRPWQHVLEPLGGYLLLAEHLHADEGQKFARAWNFGPDDRGEATVGEIAERAATAWGPGAQVEMQPEHGSPHEAGKLRLDSSLARTWLGWRPRWNLERAVSETIEGYREHYVDGDLGTFIRKQIRDFASSAYAD